MPIELSPFFLLGPTQNHLTSLRHFLDILRLPGFRCPYSLVCFTTCAKCSNETLILTYTHAYRQQTDRQQTDSRQTADRQQTDRRQTDTQTDSRQTDRQTDRHTVSQTDGQTDRQTWLSARMFARMHRRIRANIQTSN